MLGDGAILAGDVIKQPGPDKFNDPSHLLGVAHIKRMRHDPRTRGEKFGVAAIEITEALVAQNARFHVEVLVKGRQEGTEQPGDGARMAAGMGCFQFLEMGNQARVISVDFSDPDPDIFIVHATHRFSPACGLLGTETQPCDLLFSAPRSGWEFREKALFRDCVRTAQASRNRPFSCFKCFQ